MFSIINDINVICLMPQNLSCFRFLHVSPQEAWYET